MDLAARRAQGHDGAVEAIPFTRGETFAIVRGLSRMAPTIPQDGVLTIRLAQSSERAALEALQRRSSMHQPMYRAQLAAHPDAIELPAEQIAAGLVRVADLNGVIVGFAVLIERSADACELDALFVEPTQMRTGVGRRLVADAERIARERGARRIDVVANPQALSFYEAVGFHVVGEAQTRFGSASRMSLTVAAPS